MAEQLPTTHKIAATSFSLQRLMARSPVRDGGHQVAEMGEPLWVAEIETTPLSQAQAGEYAALVLRLRGGARTVYVYDASWPSPLAYPAASETDWLASSTTILASSVTALASGVTASWGAPQIVEYDRANGRVRVNGFVAGATLSMGDYGAWDDDATRLLARVVEPAVADASGETWLKIEPVPPEDDSNLPARFMMGRAAAEMVVLDARQPFSVSGRWGTTLQAVQVLRRF